MLAVEVREAPILRLRVFGFVVMFIAKPINICMFTSNHRQQPQDLLHQRTQLHPTTLQGEHKPLS